ncbi:MAG: serine/threonine-protein kinase, partial [Polyangiaceae bacterium]
ATVHLGRLSGPAGFSRTVAVKRLHPQYAKDPDFVSMFLDEARLAARIHHPNVVSILEIGSTEQGYYIVMEYVEGDTLGRLLSRAAQLGQRLPLEVGLRIVIDMLAGLEAAHELTDDDGNPLLIVHRDVSPQNVLVGVDGNAKLTDFGVARATSRLSVTRTGQLKGKVAYMAPEQARGDTEVDHRADIFAAGVVLWEVLVGRRLFKGDGEAQTLNKVLTDPIPAVGSAWPGVPPSLEAITARALERDRTIRYGTARELAEDLEKEARALQLDGSNRDVATYLEEALGPEISSQREAVRAWVTRSEPGRRSSFAQTPGPGGAATRLDRKPRSIPPPSAPGIPSISGVASLPPPPRLPAMGGPPPTAASSAASTTPRGIAAVSPSSDPMPKSPDSTRPMRAVRASDGAAVWPWLMLVAAALAGGLAWVLWTRVQPPSLPAVGPVAATSTTAAPVAPAPVEPPAVARPVPAAPVTTAAAAPAVPAVPAVEPTAAKAPSRVPRAAESSVPAAPSGPGTGKGAALPDDISRNPYR